MTLKTKLMSRMCILVALVFLINLVATRFHWYTLIWWFDMPMHFLGGFFIGLSALWFTIFTDFFDIPRWGIRKNYILVAFISTLTVGLIWEFFEYGLQAITTIILATPLDSVSDIFFDLSGGMAAALYVLDQLPETAVTTAERSNTL